MSPRICSLAADGVLIVHFAFVAFVVLGLIVILLGGIRRWRLVRNFYFRAVHLVAIGCVVMESVVGVTCPLTTWENDLRLMAGGDQYAGSFVQHWIHRVMFFQASEATFTVIYIGFFLVVVLSFFLVRPAWPECLPRASKKAQTHA